LLGVSIAYVTGDNGIITNTIKMELETEKGEVRDHFRLRITEETACAAGAIYGNGGSSDIGTKYNEQALIYYLTGHANYTGENTEKNITQCIEELADSQTISTTILKYANSEEPLNNVVVKTKYRILPEALSASAKKYGKGQTISDGDIFTLEAIGLGEGETYEGKFELRYYDHDGNVSVIDTYSLYMTNQS